PSLSAGVAIHDPGIALQVLEDMGWGNLSLPVELVDFKVAVLNEGAKLEWETARERNNRGFYVERSGDGRSWERLGFVNGAGDADEAQFYSFIDLAPLLGTNFYRLRQVDFGGEEAFSPVESIEWNRPDQRQPLVLSPNPTQDWFMVRHSTVEPPNSFRILNSAGQQVLAGAWPSNGQFNVFQLPTGVYFLEVQGRNGLDWVKWAKR
ncbi:MAG: T9SS type A sorting domain-containing protein, partial [Bacteroidota bacterium]